MNPAITTAFALAIAYVLGSVPTGLWLGLWLRGIDVRQHGSGNIGATNTRRVLGNKLGITALAGDVAKGLVSVVFVARLSGWGHAPLVCGIAAILGHTASVFLRFRGGKGVATGAGVFLGLAPIPTAIAAGAFVLIVAITRYVSLASMCAAVVLSVSLFVGPYAWPVRVIAALVAALIIYKHRSNIGRMLRGEESRFGRLPGSAAEIAPAEKTGGKGH